MSGPLLRVAVVGATGALGGELLDQMRERRFPVQELRPIATDRSLGETIEWLGHELPVATEPDALGGLDLVFVCTPPEAALDWVRRALKANVACIDFSGALSARADVPLLGDRAAHDPALRSAPLLAVPSAPALALSRALAPLTDAVEVARFVATVLDSASGAGRAGVDALQSETIALFNQEDPPQTELGHALAFDCLPTSGPPDAAGGAQAEARVSAELARLLGEETRHALTILRVPTFAGMGIQLTVETSGALAPEQAADRLAKLPGVALWPEASGPSTRDAIGDDAVQVGRLRADPSVAHGLSLWLALDPVRLVSSHALRVAEARFRSAT
jgi:aspartate-semialdehyde dehydrogenase